MQETTPRSITPSIKEFCKSISSNTPQYVTVQPASFGIINECFNNVNAYVEKYGGQQISGWTVWQRANILLEAEAHAVWQSPTGKIIDITPHIGQESQILFIIDTSVQYHGNFIPSIYKPLTDSPLVKEFIELLDRKNRIVAKASEKRVALPFNLVSRINELNWIFTSKVTRNGLCPCGSGLKYKNCCGPFAI